MKIWLSLFAVLVLATLSYLAAVHFSGGAFPTLGLPLGGDRGHLRSVALQFMEDIEFKDFEQAASYHAPEIQDSADIPFLIQRLFKVKPEALNFMDYEIVFAKIDSSGNRGRVKMRAKVEFLGNKQIRDQDIMLFFERSDTSSPWYMKLEDSLRNQTAEKAKKS